MCQKWSKSKDWTMAVIKNSAEKYFYERIQWNEWKVFVWMNSLNWLHKNMLQLRFLVRIKTLDTWHKKPRDAQNLIWLQILCSRISFILMNPAEERYNCDVNDHFKEKYFCFQIIHSDKACRWGHNCDVRKRFLSSNLKKINSKI